MKLPQVRQLANERSGKLSDTVRQLAFAGLALVWLFRSGEGASVTISPHLARIAVAFVVGLGFDVLQYLYAYSMLARFNRQMERAGITQEQEVTIKPKWNYPTFGLFAGKLGAVGVGYMLLLAFMLGHVR